MSTYSGLVERQKAFFEKGMTMEIGFRKEAMSKLRSLIKGHERELMDALKLDLNKSEFEAYLTEIGVVLSELNFTEKHLSKWAKPRKVKSTVAMAGSKSYIYPEPYGVALIISPWNYPFQLAVAPLIGAIAAGNCAILKPSELTPATSRILAELVGKTFPEDYIAVVEGDSEASQGLLQSKVDTIFFTGSVPVGRAIMEAAAKNLTPVTLELGGKSPCIVHSDANLELAAKRIAWGKYINAGQTCVAPDYLYVEKSIKNQFIRLLGEAVSTIYGTAPHEGDTFTRIVSKRHFDRLGSFLGNGRILFGGRINREKLLIEHTAIDGVDWESPVMREEIFGPILPVLEYDSLSEVVTMVNNQPKPLALYLFSETKEIQEEILAKISFGGGCINDTVMHLASPYLPFGGVGESGIGAYHGKGSFDVFSHEKSIMKQTTKFDLPFRYQKTKDALKKIKLFLK
ncbi:aldehyde dehydrogenase family protein [Neobacillus piezotolerans]|uniref:Aldehyde dehydrogenase n=1 Tax=Neobacillus piezotolerans TaxID=2259171 RepID=A0A3D8GND0_9BACI|nr:aldehyde dehydrogenase [Neobacillus piezotolerans]RDU35739.1 aldehyde dehydrogenase family protein [Neobacillus piezotolerans]